MLLLAEVFDSTVKIAFYSVLFKALVAQNQKGIWFREEKTPYNLRASIIMGTYIYGWGRRDTCIYIPFLWQAMHLTNLHGVLVQ